MHTKLLIDNIVRQTTVLIAELSTAAGVRAPLSHIADQVFLDLARAIEAQGVGRKVVADMFGLALRSYQKRVQRLTESESVRDRTLWEAVVDFLRDSGGASRARVFERFNGDEERDVAAVLNDLVGSGVAYVSGRGERTVYGLTSDADQRSLAEGQLEASLPALLWMTVYHRGGTTEAELVEAVGVPVAQLSGALAGLVDEGRVQRGDDGIYRAETMTIPLGSRAGWEAAVFDHYQAVAKAIAHKLRDGGPRSDVADEVGGATLTFDVWAGHPRQAEVRALLRDVRARINTLWDDVTAYNEANPAPEHGTSRVTFYFGQNVELLEPLDVDDTNEGASGDA